MLTQEQIQKIQSGELKKVFHLVKGAGEIESFRVDKLANNRLKAKINFIIPDLLEDVIKPEFLYLDDANLSAE